MALTQEQIAYLNGLYTEAWKLAAEEISFDGREPQSIGAASRAKLERAKSLFETVVASHPTGWQAMFAIGKIEQRFGCSKAAFDWFLKAREFDPQNTALAKESSAAASRLGMHDMAARIVDEAIALNPNDPALRVNSGLAHVLAGHPDIALERFGDAVRLEPTELNRSLRTYATRLLAGAIPRPKTEADILKFMRG